MLLSRNHARLNLESLEGRVLADAKMPIAMPAALGNAALVRTVNDPAPQIANGLSSAATPMHAAPMSAANSGYQYTAFTIVNNSNATVAYSIEWGNGSWTSFTIAPHQERTHWFPALNEKATISYDKSFAAGYQDQRYTLTGTNITFPAGFYLVQPTPSLGSGHQYTFGNVSGGVQLYS